MRTRVREHVRAPRSCASSSRRCARSSSVSCGPRSSSSASRPCADGQLERLEHRLVALPAGGPPEREQAQRRGRRRATADGAKRSTSIAWPIPRTFGESSGNERRSTLRTTSASARREPERPVGVPVRVPEERAARGAASRAAPRAARKSRDHVREHGVGRASLPKVPQPARASKRTPRPTPRSRAERRAARTFAGKVVRARRGRRGRRPARSASASARTRSTVCASAGCSASTTWVTNTSRVRRSGAPRPSRPVDQRRSRTAKSSAVWCQSA